MKKSEWHLWFAWYPVQIFYCGGMRWFWLTTVWRKTTLIPWARKIKRHHEYFPVHWVGLK